MCGCLHILCKLNVPRNECYSVPAGKMTSQKEIMWHFIRKLFLKD